MCRLVRLREVISAAFLNVHCSRWMVGTSSVVARSNREFEDLPVTEFENHFVEERSVVVKPKLASTLVRLAARVGSKHRRRKYPYNTPREESGSFVVMWNSVRRLPSTETNRPLAKPSDP